MIGQSPKVFLSTNWRVRQIIEESRRSFRSAASQTTIIAIATREQSNSHRSETGEREAIALELLDLRKLLA